MKVKSIIMIEVHGPGVREEGLKSWFLLTFHWNDYLVDYKEKCYGSGQLYLIEHGESILRACFEFYLTLGYFIKPWWLYIQ